MLLDPLGRAHQAFFFAVPTAEDERALRLPSRLQQFADAVYRFEHRRGAAVGIDRAIDPGVAMIAGDHPFVGQFAAAHAADHVPQRAELIVLLEMHLHLRRPGTDVIGEGQRALPLARRIRSAEMLAGSARHRDTKAA